MSAVERVETTISSDDRDALAKLASAGDRSIAAEIRRAIKAHLKNATAQAAA